MIQDNHTYIMDIVLMLFHDRPTAVSYTHLDVYKRQVCVCVCVCVCVLTLYSMGRYSHAVAQLRGVSGASIQGYLFSHFFVIIKHRTITKPVAYVIIRLINKRNYNVCKLIK